MRFLSVIPRTEWSHIRDIAEELASNVKVRQEATSTRSELAFGIPDR